MSTETDSERLVGAGAQFEARALEFLRGRARPRADVGAGWGVGPENLALFHETSGAAERAECAAARDWQRARWAAGFGWLTGPVECGGAGLGAEYDRRYRELEAGFDVPDMNPLRIGLGTVGPAVLRFGTPEQVRRFCVGLYSGELVACQLFSEPDAGSDLAGVRTRAVRDGTGQDGADWVLDGQKVWTSNATFADLGLALVRTDPDAPRHRGLTMFLVPMDADGVEVRPLRQLTGGASFTEVFLTGVRVPDGHRIGAVGAGWSVALGALAGERRAVGDRSHELTARAWSLLGELATRSGRGDDPLVRDALVRLYGRLRIARFQQQRMQAAGPSPGGAERAVDKLLLTTNLRLVGELAAELAGPAFVADTGEWGTFGWNRWALGALGYRIAGGTEEILRTMLAERVLALPKEPR